jgi:hypothetical protein
LGRLPEMLEDEKGKLENIKNMQGGDEISIKSLS